jgi:GNAT superfamily N-acetyltransferase
MSPAFGPIVRVWTASGATGLVKALRSRAWQRLRFVQFRIDLDAWEPGPPPAAPLEIRYGLAELMRFRDRADSPLPVQFFQDEMHGAASPYLGLWGGEVGHISWLFAAGEPGRRLRLVTLEPGDVELDGAFTFRGFRGRGLLAAVEREMLRDAKLRGAHVAYTHVQTDNVASIKGVQKTGFVPHGIVTFFRACGMSWTRCEPYRPIERTDLAPILPGKPVARRLH